MLRLAKIRAHATATVARPVLTAHFSHSACSRRTASQTIPSLFLRAERAGSATETKRRIEGGSPRPASKAAAKPGRKPVHKREKLPKLASSPNSNQLDQLVQRLAKSDAEQRVRQLTERGTKFIHMRQPDALFRLLEVTEDMEYTVGLDWAIKAALFLSRLPPQNLLGPETMAKTIALLEARVEPPRTPADVNEWRMARFKMRFRYVKHQEQLLRSKLHLVFDEQPFAAPMADAVHKLDPRGVLLGMLDECLEVEKPAYRNDVLYTMRTFLGHKHREWTADVDALRWAESGSAEDQLYVWLRDRYGSETLPELLKLVGRWNADGSLGESGQTGHQITRALVKALMDRGLYAHAASVASKNGRFLHSNPLPKLLCEHKLYPMAAGSFAVSQWIDAGSDAGSSNLVTLMGASAERSMGSKNDRGVESALRLMSSAPTDPVTCEVAGAALVGAKQQHEVASLLAAMETHGVAVCPSSLLAAADYWMQHNVNVCLQLFRRFCSSPQAHENSHFGRSSVWKSATHEPLARLVDNMAGKTRMWQDLDRLAVLFESINALPEHALRAHFPQILKLYRKVAHTVSQDYTGYTLGGTDHKIVTEARLLTRLALILRKQIAVEDKALHTLQRQFSSRANDQEYATRILTQMRVKLARKLTALVKEIARRQLSVELYTAFDFCRVLSDGSLYLSTLSAWRAYMAQSGMVPKTSYDADKKTVFLFESPNLASELDCTFLMDGDQSHYVSRHVAIFDKPAKSSNSLRSIESIITMMNELDRDARHRQSRQQASSDGDVVAAQKTMLNDLYSRGKTLLETVRSPSFHFKYNQLLAESYIRCAAHFNPAGAVAAFASIDFQTCDGNVWAAIVASCIDEDVHVVYQQALSRNVCDQTALHNQYLLRSVATQSWEGVGAGIENLYAYGQFPSPQAMEAILEHSEKAQVDVQDLLVEISKSCVPVYSKSVSLKILDVLSRSSDSPNEAVEHYANLRSSVGAEGLSVIAQSLDSVDSEIAVGMVSKFLALASHTPLEYLSRLLKYSPDSVFAYAEEQRDKRALSMTVGSVEEFVVAALNEDIPPYRIYRFLWSLRTVPDTLSVAALKTALLEMPEEDARKEYSEITRSMTSQDVSLDKLMTARDLFDESYGDKSALRAMFHPDKLLELAAAKKTIIPNIFDGLYNGVSIPTHSVFFDYNTFDPELRVPMVAGNNCIDVSVDFEGSALQEEYTSRYRAVYDTL